MVALWFYQKFELNVVSNINVIAYSFFNKYLSEKGPVLFAACVVLALSLLNYLLFRRGKKIAYALIFFYLLFTQYCADAGKNPLSRYLAERRSVLNAARDEKIPAYFYAQQRLNLQQDQFALFKSRLKYVPTVFTDPREKIQEKNHFLISAAISPTILENYELLDFFEDKFYLVPAEKSAPSLRIGAYKAYSFSKKVLAPRDKNFDAPVSVNEKQDYYGLRVTFLKGSYNIKINYETTRKSPRSRVKLTVAECDAREIPVFELARYYLEEAELAKDFFDFDLEFDKNVLFFRLDLESDGETEIKISSIEIAHKIAIKK
jgi:hypothetical protein